MNDALMETFHDLDLARILPGILAAVGIVVALILARKILRVMLRLGRKRVAGGWASCDPELDQLFQLAAASGQLTHEDVSDDSGLILCDANGDKAADNHRFELVTWYLCSVQQW